MSPSEYVAPYGPNDPSPLISLELDMDSCIVSAWNPKISPGTSRSSGRIASTDPGFSDLSAESWANESSCAVGVTMSSRRWPICLRSPSSMESSMVAALSASPSADDPVGPSPMGWSIGRPCQVPVGGCDRHARIAGQEPDSGGVLEPAQRLPVDRRGALLGPHVMGAAMCGQPSAHGGQGRSGYVERGALRRSRGVLRGKGLAKTDPDGPGPTRQRKHAPPALVRPRQQHVGPPERIRGEKS